MPELPPRTREVRHDYRVEPSQSEGLLGRIRTSLTAVAFRLCGDRDDDRETTDGTSVRSIVEGLRHGAHYGAEEARTLLEDNTPLQLWKHLSSFSGLTAEIAHQLIDVVNEGELYRLGLWIDCFVPEDHLEIARRLFEISPYCISNSFEMFAALPGEMALWLFRDHPRVVLTNLDRFEGHDLCELVTRIYLDGDEYILREYKSIVQRINYHDVISRLIVRGAYRQAGYCLREQESLSEFTDSIVDLIRHDPLSIEAFTPSSVEQLRLTEAQARVVYDVALNCEDIWGGFGVLMSMLRYSPRVEGCAIPPWYFEVFSDGGSREVVQCIDDLRQGKRSEDAEKVGISTTGESAIDQLYQTCQELKNRLKQIELTDEDERLLATSMMARRVLMAMTGIANSDYGVEDDDDLEVVCVRHRHDKQHGICTEPPEGYAVSRVYRIDKRADRDNQPVITEDAERRYVDLMADMDAAQDALDEPFGFGRLVRDVRWAADEIACKLDDDIYEIDMNDPGAAIKRQNLVKRQTELTEYIASLDADITAERRFVMNSPEDMQRGIRVLGNYSAAYPEMRRLMMAWAMRRSGEMSEIAGELPLAYPSLADIESLWLAVDQMQTQVYGQQFDDARTRQQFLRITSAVSLEKEIARHEKAQRVGNTTSLQFVPTRGIFMEISGEIASACWAGAYSSIGAAMPNISALIMRARPGERSERIVGAALLIETTDIDTGEGVLVLRGFNPSENYIQQVNVKDFYEAAIDYVKETARARHLKPAIVIDRSSPGATTNREVLFDYINRLRRSKRLRVDDADSTFNGYDLTHITYAL